jgi:anti-sigma factor RsiW
LNAHLSECAACAAFADDLRATTALLRGAPLASLSEPLTLATTRRPRRRRIRVGAGAGAAVAAMLVLGVGISSLGDSAQAPSAPFDGSALGERQNWDGIQSRPIALRHAAPEQPTQSDPA